MRKVLACMAALFWAWIATQAQTSEHVYINGAKGRLDAIVQRPAMKEGQKCPLVIICHGFGGNKESELLTRMADTLQAHGVAAIRFDFNGHGKSEGSFMDMTVPNEIDDAKCVYRYACNLPYADTSKIAMAGHSQGGVVTGMTAGDLGSRLAAVVLLAPAAVLREDAIRGNTMGASYDPLNPPEYVTLRGDKRLGREYIISAFRLPIFETSAKYHGPACMIHGTGDRVVPFSYSERYHEIWPGSQIHIMEGEDHGFKHDMDKAVKLATSYLLRELLEP